MLSALVARCRIQRAQQRNAEIVFIADLAIREIKRRTIQQLLSPERRVPMTAYKDVSDSAVIEGSAVEVRQP
jgi:hypothetical protein